MARCPNQRRPAATIADTVELPRGEIGELIVRGPRSRPNTSRARMQRMAKIADPTASGTAWATRVPDEQDRFWYCGRVSHRVVLADRTLYTEQVEAIFNTHPAVRRSALVGRKFGTFHPFVVIEPLQKIRSWLGAECLPLEDQLKQLTSELNALGKTHQITKTCIRHVFISSEFAH